MEWEDCKGREGKEDKKERGRKEEMRTEEEYSIV